VKRGNNVQLWKEVIFRLRKEKDALQGGTLERRGLMDSSIYLGKKGKNL